MSRLAAYLGPEISLAQFLLRPAHGLVAPGRNDGHRVAGRDAGGFGIGWFGPDGPLAYTCAMPVWCDHNLVALGQALNADLWIAHTRDAEAGTIHHVADVQPFADAEFLFVHDAHLADFTAGLRAQLREALEPEFEAAIRGTSGSEHLFALLRQILARDTDMPVNEGLGELVGFVEENAGEESVPLNVVIGDGSRLFALRHTVNGECHELYFTTDDEDFPDGMLVASAPLTEAELWQAVPEHHLLILDPEAPAQLLAL
jgi:glutamine amidotransferase